MYTIKMLGKISCQYGKKVEWLDYSVFVTNGLFSNDAIIIDDINKTDIRVNVKLTVIIRKERFADIWISVFYHLQIK